MAPEQENVNLRRALAEAQQALIALIALSEALPAKTGAHPYKTALRAITRQYPSETRRPLQVIEAIHRIANKALEEAP